jgi:starvation-inducible outer membrane lipoprotein
MLKLVLRLLLLILAGMLAACGSAPAATNSSTVLPSALPPDDTGALPTAVIGLGGRLYAAQDLSVIAATGRPQFLNAYADW